AVRFAVGIDLARSGARLGQAIGSREGAEQIVETVILEIDDDDVLKTLDPLRRIAGGLRRAGSGQAGDGDTQDKGADDRERTVHGWTPEGGRDDRPAVHPWRAAIEDRAAVALL